MDLPIHNQILWRACEMARDRLAKSNPIADPCVYFPLLSRGSWMNDTNQVTILTDVLKSPAKDAAQAAGPFRTFLGAYWKLELERVIGELRYDPTNDYAGQAAPIAAMATDIDGFGAYDRFDHLDVLIDDPAAEYGGPRAKPLVGLAGTVADLPSKVLTRLHMSTVSNPVNRLNTSRVTILGRALHSLQDFYAHTNWIELLLWEAALVHTNPLASGIIDIFNRKDLTRPFARGVEEPYYCPLPKRGASVGDDAVMWFGHDPGTTPLVSTVFGTSDTAYSLLGMYSNHLVRIGPSTSNDEQLDFVLAILDVSGNPVSSKGLELLVGAGQLVRDAVRWIGKGARAWLASIIEDRAAGAGEAKGLMETAARLIREYDAEEAAEWARAGRLRYLAFALKKDIAGKLKAQDPDKHQLPNHTLLTKDHPYPALDDMVRFQLACYFATELTAQVLEWHFGSAPVPQKNLEDLFTKWLAHPCAQLSVTPNPPITTKVVADLAQRFCFGSWTKSVGVLPPVIIP